MNGLDIAVVIILILCVLRGYRDGLLMALYSLSSWVIGLLVARALYPMVSRFLLYNTVVHQFFKDYFINTLNLDQVITTQTIRAQTEFIQQLPLPDFLTQLLITNNNAEIFRVLNVVSVEEYIGAFLATLTVNIISIICVFLLTRMVLRLLFDLLRLFEAFPVIKQFNKLGGIILGAGTGILLIWLLMVVFTFFLLRPETQFVWDLMLESRLTLLLFRNNLLMNMISSIL